LIVRGLARSATFRHGVHPDDHKEITRALAIERMPFVRDYVLPLSQHTGAPSRPLVGPGMRVRRGQMVAAPDGYVSTALHAPVTGTVKAIELRPHPNGRRMPAIVLEIDPFDSQRFESDPPAGVDALPPAEVVRLVQEAGIVGLGGAAFPSHVKLQVPRGKHARFVILNGCECEPYLTCDHRVMVERPDDVVRGLRTILRILGAERGYVGIEDNKPDAVEAIRAASGGDGSIIVVPLEVKYPQGAEKFLIDAILHREVPSGKLPIDLEVVVHNVGTAVALTDLLERGKPLIERVVTVSGDGVRRPANLLVPVGTPIAKVLEHCGGLHPATRQVILGGPMMGLSQKDLDAPILKGASGLLALREPAETFHEDPCIRCGRCLEACPMFLNPSRLAALAKHDDVDGLVGHHVLDCCECASCSFVCPSNIPLVQWMRVGKATVRAQGKKS
jgi:electron transport complex protein RnfC